VNHGDAAAFRDIGPSPRGGDLPPSPVLQQAFLVDHIESPQQGTHWKTSVCVLSVVDADDFISTGQLSDFGSRGVGRESKVPLPGANESQERDKSVESDQTADSAGSTESDDDDDVFYLFLQKQKIALPLTSASRAFHVPACQRANAGYCAFSGG
jgi:hypothetical protein